jgi:hypothetical protein
MRGFKTFLPEDLSNLEYTGNDNAFALKVLSDIDDAIGSINTEIEIDVRPNKQSGARLGISQAMPEKQREKFAGLAKDIIEKTDGLTLRMDKVPSDRKEKDYAFEHSDMSKYIYVNCRPDGGRGALGDDPHELMTAALCLKAFPKAHTIENSDQMDQLLELVKGQLKNVRGFKQSQVDAMADDYSNLCKAVSAANAIIAAGYGGADTVYLTGQAWDDDVKEFQMSRYGMNDFNSSDFIIKKGKNYVGISLKKKKRSTESDPTLINKAFTGLLADKKFDKIKAQIDDDAGAFYLHVIRVAQRLQILSPELQKELKKSKPTRKNWKTYIQRIPNDLVNRVLKGKQTLFRTMANTIDKNSDLIASQLIQLIFKSDLKELKKVNFDFALVTGIGDYGPKKGVVVEKGEYKDIDTTTTMIDELFSSGKPRMILTPGAKQAFDPGAKAASLKFTLMIGSATVADITLRYKGNFRAAPNFTAEMTSEFKKLFKA